MELTNDLENNIKEMEQKKENVFHNNKNNKRKTKKIAKEDDEDVEKNDSLNSEDLHQTLQFIFADPESMIWTTSSNPWLKYKYGRHIGHVIRQLHSQDGEVVSSKEICHAIFNSCYI